MNYWISILFRIIPLAMGAVCLSLGLYVLTGGADANHFVAGHVLIALTAICIALFTTAATIIRQLTQTFSRTWKVIFPVIGYSVAFATMICGLLILQQGYASSFVAGHVVFGVGLIAACVSTVAAASSAFTLIPKNAHGRAEDGAPPGAYSSAAPASTSRHGFSRGWAPSASRCFPSSRSSRPEHRARHSRASARPTPPIAGAGGHFP